MKTTAYTLVALAVACAACGDDDSNDRVVVVPDQAPATDRVVEQTNIVSNKSGATARDPNLQNAWGLAFNPIGAAWVSANGTGMSGVYGADGSMVIPDVMIPPAGSADTSAPTGQVFNSDSSAFKGDVFIFVGEDGGITGWQPDFGGSAMMRVDNSGDDAIYKGVAIAQANDGWRLFVADFHNNQITVYDANYKPMQVSGDFTDPDLPDGFAPFGIEAAGDGLLVAYALQDKNAEDDVKGLGNGYVDRYDLDGNLTARVLSANELNSPWGMLVTPAGFAAAPNKLLVGNFGDGLIHVYTMDVTDLAATATLEGTLTDPNGNDLVIDGLWALEFGPDAGGFTSDQVYFTAGPNDEKDGIFGVLSSSSASGNNGGTNDGGTNNGGTNGGHNNGGMTGSGGYNP